MAALTIDDPATTSIMVMAGLNVDARVVRLLESTSARSFYLSMPWWRSLAEAALERDEALRIYVAETSEGPRAALMACAGVKAVGGARVLRALANMYSVEYGVVGETPEVDATILSAFAKTIAAERPAWDVVDLGPFERSATCFSRLAYELRTAGFWVQPYFHFGMWYEQVAGRDFATFLASRPGALRNTLKRSPVRLEQIGRVKIESACGSDGLALAISAYEGVHARSWKPSEPHPNFMPRLMREAAAVGALRLGILRVNGAPIAAQVWIVWHRRATIFKLAHDERYKHASPGSVLTMHMLRRAIEIDRVDEIDFGRGDDPYKRSWLGERREYWCLLACNPRTPRGLAAIVRHHGGAAAARAVRRLASMLGTRRAH